LTFLYKDANILSPGKNIANHQPERGRKMNTKLLRILEKTPVEKLGKILKILSDKINAHRKTHNGLVPLPIFPYCIGVAGLYPTVEMVVKVISKNKGKAPLFAVKKRTDKEQGWGGKYHIIGTVGRRTDDPEIIFKRLVSELSGLVNANTPKKFVGIQIHAEPERHAIAWTLVWMVKIKEEKISLLPPGWILVKNFNDRRIIWQQRRTLKWVNDPKRKLFADLR
jgi:hypothetical protein